MSFVKSEEVECGSEAGQYVEEESQDAASTISCVLFADKCSDLKKFV
jgi:hypothetical protein